jgi:hypothetical protein
MASTVEWAFHKFNMHETDDVHILHHAETNRDMSMPEDYNITAIQFPRSASLMIAAGGVPLLATLDALFQLNIPYWEVRAKHELESASCTSPVGCNVPCCHSCALV